MKRTLLITAFCLPLWWQADAQVASYTRTLNATGGSKAIGGNIYEWSVGEMPLVNTASASNIIVTQGVLQPADDKTGITGIDNRLYGMQLYPNPASTLVNLSYDLFEAGLLSLEMQDVAGKSIYSKKLDVKPGKNIEQLPLQAVANGTYMLNVYFTAANGAQKSTSFKIEKIEK